MCGGTIGYGVRRAGVFGLSPRVRGNLISDAAGPKRWRSIPACAGEPAESRCTRSAGTVYPRVCGGTQPERGGGQADVGLSPRVRGNRRFRSAGPPAPGSIPACAGEPLKSAPAIQISEVYPRVCGGTHLTSTPSPTASGLSPRVRGNLCRVEGGEVTMRSIPACAGEPGWSWAWCSAFTVYPRVCGGTRQWDASRPGVMGLSPRVRGNHVHRTIATR